MMKKLWILLCIGTAQAKVLVLTCAFNRPDFIYYQAECLKKFMQDSYEFVVFNDAREANFIERIAIECKKNNITHVRIPQHIHERPYLQRKWGENYQAPSVRTANALQFALDKVGFKHNDIVMILDSDMFLIKPFSVRQYLKQHIIAGVPQNRRHINYLWNGILFFRNNKLPDKRHFNLNCGLVENVLTDTGGYLHYYLKKHRDLPLQHMSVIHIPQILEQVHLEYIDAHAPELFKKAVLEGLTNIEFYLDATFFHYRSGTNWDAKGAEYHQRKTILFDAVMREVIKK